MTTVVLVHGALTDASVWSGVTARLHAAGHHVLAPAMPLRGLASDAAHLAAVLRDVDDDVVLVGHSYGGSVISHPDAVTDAVRALVFVSAFQPDTNESTGELNGRWPGSLLGPDTTTVVSTPTGDELALRPESFGPVYAADLPATTVAVLAAQQRPIVVTALEESFDGSPTWSRLPSWALVSTDDRSLPPAAMRAMAERAGSTVTEVTTSHASPLTSPDTVTALIDDATH